MNDVAKELGISKKTIYTIFESKQVELVGIADRYARDFTDMREAIEQDDRLDTLEKLEAAVLQRFLPNITISPQPDLLSWSRSIRSSTDT